MHILFPVQFKPDLYVSSLRPLSPSGTPSDGSLPVPGLEPRPPIVPKVSRQVRYPLRYHGGGLAKMNLHDLLHTSYSSNAPNKCTMAPRRLYILNKHDFPKLPK